MHLIYFSTTKLILDWLSQHLVLVYVLFLDLICTAQWRGRLLRGSAYTRVFTVIICQPCDSFFSDQIREMFLVTHSYSDAGCRTILVCWGLSSMGWPTNSDNYYNSRTSCSRGKKRRKYKNSLKHTMPLKYLCLSNVNE